MSSRAPVFILN